MKKLTEKKRRDLEAFEALPPSIREYLLAYAAGMVAGAELKKKATSREPPPEDRRKEGTHGEKNKALLRDVHEQWQRAVCRQL